jgi:hypothetical protein
MVVDSEDKTISGIDQLINTNWLADNQYNSSSRVHECDGDGCGSGMRESIWQLSLMAGGGKQET